MQRVKPPTVTPASLIRVLGRVLALLLLARLPANVPGKGVGNGASTQATAKQVSDPDGVSAKLLAAAQLTLDCCSYLESEPVAGRLLSLSLLFCLSNKNTFFFTKEKESLNSNS